MVNTIRRELSAAAGPVGGGSDAVRAETASNGARRARVRSDTVRSDAVNGEGSSGGGSASVTVVPRGTVHGKRVRRWKRPTPPTKRGSLSQNAPRPGFVNVGRSARRRTRWRKPRYGEHGGDHANPHTRSSWTEHRPRKLNSRRAVSNRGLRYRRDDGVRYGFHGDPAGRRLERSRNGERTRSGCPFGFPRRRTGGTFRGPATAGRTDGHPFGGSFLIIERPDSTGSPSVPGRTRPF